MQKSAQDPFESLVAPHLQTLYRVAYRLVRNAPDAQDLVQDTCVAAYANLPSLAAAESPLRWLLRVQHNRFIDQHRRRRRSPVAATSEADLDAIASELPDPEQLIQQFQSEQLLEQAFLRLEDMARTLLALRAEGYELLEIESITGVDRTVLSTRLHRARMRLAQLVTELHREAGRTRSMGSGQ